MAAQQAVAKGSDPHAMYGLAGFTCVGSTLIPSFIEYLFAALSLTYMQPIRIYFLQVASTGEDFQQILFQHSLILALGLSISWTYHSDCRHNWLRLPAAQKYARKASTRLPPPNASFRPSRKGTAPASALAAATAQNRNWDQLDDDCFSEADCAELRADATRVRRSPRTAWPRALPPDLSDRCAARRCLDRTWQSWRSGWRGRRTLCRGGTAPPPSSALARSVTCTRSSQRTGPVRLIPRLSSPGARAHATSPRPNATQHQLRRHAHPRGRPAARTVRILPGTGRRPEDRPVMLIAI